MSPRTVGALLPQATRTVDVRATLADVVIVLGRHGGDAVAVVHDGSFLGVVLRRDLAAARPSAATTLEVREAMDALGRIPVTSIMRRDVATVIPDTPLAEAARLVRDSGNPVAVLDAGRLAGLLGVGELLAALAPD